MSGRLNVITRVLKREAGGSKAEKGDMMIDLEVGEVNSGDAGRTQAAFRT